MMSHNVYVAFYYNIADNLADTYMLIENEQIYVLNNFVYQRRGFPVPLTAFVSMSI